MSRLEHCLSATSDLALLAITTVGYGEIIPRSFLGRLITLPLLMFGLLLIALPSFVLGREFASVWDGMGGTKVSSNPPFHGGLRADPLPDASYGLAT